MCQKACLLTQLFLIWMFWEKQHETAAWSLVSLTKTPKYLNKKPVKSSESTGLQCAYTWNPNFFTYQPRDLGQVT